MRLYSTQVSFWGSNMQGQDNTKDELQMLRDLLLRPLVEQNKARDQKIMEFIEQFSTELTARLSTLETRVAELAAEVDNRGSAVCDIGEGIATLGQQLRQLASKAEAARPMPSEKDSAKSAKA